MDADVELILKFWLFAGFAGSILFGGYQLFHIVQWFNNYLDHKAGNDKDPSYREYKEWMKNHKTFGMDYKAWKEKFKK